MTVQASGWAWTRRVNPRLVDILLAAVLAVLGLGAVMFDPSVRPANASPALLGLAVALVLTQSVPLVWRRDRPVAVLAIIGATYGLKFLVGLSPTPPGAIAALIALYSVSAYSRTRWRSLAGAGAAVVFVIAAGVIVIGGNLPSLAPLTATVIVLSGAWLLGDYLRTRRAYLAELEAKAARLERDRTDDLRQAAEEERARIARELHDVVSHDVSLMVVQAGAARTVQADRPDAATAALALIENTGRQTLTELSHLLGVLRRTDGSTPVRSPQPGVDQLDTLLAPLREAAIEAQLSTRGAPRPLPAALDLSVFRVVQEATTNVLKHSRATRVEIVLRYDPDNVVLVIHDNGRGQRRGEQAGPDRAPGHGLIGMRERVALYGGQFSAGPAARGGFTVFARFPLPPG